MRTIEYATAFRKDFGRELDAARQAMPMGDSVMEEVRRGGPY